MDTDTDKDDPLEEAYQQTILEQRIDKIWQKLFWYDNVPSDEDIAHLVMKWREYRTKLKRLNVESEYTR